VDWWVSEKMCHDTIHGKNSITKVLGYFLFTYSLYSLNYMHKTVLLVLGAILVLVGLLGFVNNPILGIFEVDLLHNIIHLITGAALLYAGVAGNAMGARFVKILAVTYTLVAIIGLVSSDSILGLFVANFADDVLHVVLAIILIWLGFFNGKEVASMTASPSGENTMGDNNAMPPRSTM